MIRVLAILTAVLLAPAVASAAIIVYSADLSGPNEFPPVASTGTGEATVTIDTDLRTMLVETTWSDLVYPTTVAHIHCCVDPNAATPIANVATTVPTFPGFPAGVLSGSYSMSFDLTDAATYNPAFVTANGGTPAGAEAALLAGLDAGFAYLNIHSEVFTSGEIRGFLNAVPVPEPGTALLVAAALAGLARVRRL
jgi:hypothetical protein